MLPLERCQGADCPKALAVLQHSCPQRCRSVLDANRNRILVEDPGATHGFVVCNGRLRVCWSGIAVEGR